MRSRAWGRGLAAALAALVVTGCASLERPRPGDGSFAAGEFPAAVVEYEEQLRREPALAVQNPELVYRLAVARAVPGHAGSDPARARELLEPLLGNPELRARAQALLALVTELEHLRRRQEELATEAELTSAWLRHEEAMRATCEARAQEQGERVTALEALLEEVTARAERLARELDAIKRIDLQRPR